jgi:hypothetical protein
MIEGSWENYNKLVQSVLGYVSEKKFSMDRATIPWWDRLHVGRLLFLVGVVNVYLGILLYSDRYDVGGYVQTVYFAVIVAGALAFVYGEVKLGQDNHVKHA